MLIFIGIILAWFFVIAPLYKSLQKMNSAKALNQELDRLADLYSYAMATNRFPDAYTHEEEARQTVYRFMEGIRFTPQELAQVAPAVTRFPCWQIWLRIRQ